MKTEARGIARGGRLMTAIVAGVAAATLFNAASAEDRFPPPALTDKEARGYVQFFSSLVVDYCISNISDLVGLDERLATDPDFKPFEDLDGTFETYYENVSFAITTYNDVCTVDVMLLDADHGVLFQLQHIDERLTAITETADKSFQRDVDYGPDDNEVEVMVRSYRTSNGVTLQLIYPVNDPGGMYMYVDVFIE